MEQKYNQDDIEFLIATQNRTSMAFLKSIFRQSDFTLQNILIVNQTDANHQLLTDYPNIRVINTFETGLSQSRNLALKNARGKILVFTDDDVEYFENTPDMISNAYNTYKNADAIHFQAQKNSSQLLKKYSKTSQDPSSIFAMLNCSSIEITLKNENGIANDVTFDERFGINAAFGFGEEALFLNALKQSGRKIVFVNQTIVQHESSTTTGRNSLEQNYYVHGAFNKQLFGKYHYFWLWMKIFFDLKQKKIKPSQVLQVLKYAKQGRKHLDYLNKEAKKK